MIYRRYLVVSLWKVIGLLTTLGLFFPPNMASASEEVDCVDSMKQQAPRIPFSGPFAVDYLDLYDQLERIVYVYPKTEGKEDYSLFLFTDNQVYKIKFKPTSQNTFLVTARNPGARFFQVRNTKGKILSLFRSEIESPLDKYFSLKPIPIEQLDAIKDDHEVVSVTAEPVVGGSELAAAKASFIKSYWPVWEQSVPSNSGLKGIFGSSEENWKAIKDSCGSFFDKIEVDDVCHPNQVCGKIIPKSAKAEADQGDDRYDADHSPQVNEDDSSLN